MKNKLKKIAGIMNKNYDSAFAFFWGLFAVVSIGYSCYFAHTGDDIKNLQSLGLGILGQINYLHFKNKIK